MSERIAIAITKCQLPANYQWMMREGLEQDMRRRGIAEHDIDRTILYLTNALQENSIKVRFRAPLPAGCSPAHLVLSRYV